MLVKTFLNILLLPYNVNEPFQQSKQEDGIASALVTGGTGFIGSHTVELLLQRGFTVRCLVRATRHGMGWLEGLPVEIVKTDFLDRASLIRAVQDIDTIFHIAGVTKAKSDDEYVRGNVQTTEALLEAACANPSLQKFCFVGSLTAVGPSPDGTPLTEDSPCHPITAYGRSKLEAEQLCLSYRERIPLVVLRPPAVYGPRDRDVFEIFRGVHLGISPIFGKGEKTLSLIHGADLARALIEATLAETTTGQVYFATDPVVYRYSDLVATLATLMKKRTLAIRIPPLFLQGLASVIEGVSYFLSSPAILNTDKARDLLQPHWVCSGRKLEEHTGFTVSVPIEERLRTTYAWYRHHGWL